MNSEKLTLRAEPKENIPLHYRVVVVTNFLYIDYTVLPEGKRRRKEDTDGIRGDLALKLITNALDQGVRVVAADGGSSRDFLQALKKFEGIGLTVVPCEIPGRAPQRRAAFEHAINLPGVEAVVYTQAEKESLIKNNLQEMTQPILADDADIAILARDPKLFKKSYPTYMRKSELRVNKTYNWLLKREGLLEKDQSFDWFFGPFVFRNDPKVVALFLEKYKTRGKIRSRIGATPDPEKHSGSHYFPLMKGFRKGMKVISITVPFEYPKIQRKNEISPKLIKRFSTRRKLDGAAYRLEAIHFLAYLNQNPHSQIKRT